MYRLSIYNFTVNHQSQGDEYFLFREKGIGGSRHKHVADIKCVQVQGEKRNEGKDTLCCIYGSNGQLLEILHFEFLLESEIIHMMHD